MKIHRIGASDFVRKLFIEPISKRLTLLLVPTARLVRWTIYSTEKFTKTPPCVTGKKSELRTLLGRVPLHHTASSAPASPHRKPLERGKPPAWKTAKASVRWRCGRKASPGGPWAVGAAEASPARCGAVGQAPPRCGGAGSAAGGPHPGARSYPRAPPRQLSVLPPATLSAILRYLLQPRLGMSLFTRVSAKSCSAARCSQAVLRCSPGATSTRANRRAPTPNSEQEFEETTGRQQELRRSEKPHTEEPARPTPEQLLVCAFAPFSLPILSLSGKVSSLGPYSGPLSCSPQPPLSRLPRTR